MSLTESSTESSAHNGSVELPVDRHRLTVEGIQAATVAMDLLLVWASEVLAGLIWLDNPVASLGLLGGMTPSGLIGGFLFVGFLALRRSYSPSYLSNPRRQLHDVTLAWAFAFFVLGWFAFLMKTSGSFSRGATAVHFALGFLLVSVFHVVGARWLGRHFARASLSLRRVAVIAVAEEGAADRIRASLALKGVEVVRTTVISPQHLGRQSFHANCLTAVGDVRTALAAAKLDGIYLFLSWQQWRHIEELRATLGPMPVPVHLFADRETEALFNRPQLQIGAFRGFEIQRAPLTRFDRAIKRAMDLMVAGSAVVVLSPLLGLTALAILVETGRPILFRQTRKGFGARPFEILKFRSMTVQENGTDVKQATRGDARITRLGAVLRKSSIDELPQLLNVLRGEMSIVGPRPHAIAHDDHYDQLIATYAFRQHVKPGITGWAQVNGHRGETREVGQMSARVEHDLWYINHWSPWLDVKIIVRTALKVLNDHSAY